jgi:hypothetical protein
MRTANRVSRVPPELVAAPAPAAQDPRYHDVANAGRCEDLAQPCPGGAQAIEYMVPRCEVSR